MKKKIVFVIDNLRIGGTQKLTIEVINHLLENDVFVIDLIVLTSDIPADSLKPILSEKINNITYVSLNENGFISRIKNLSNLLNKYDLVHSCMELSNLYVSLARLVTPSKTKFVITFHGIDGYFIKDEKLKTELKNNGAKQKFLNVSIQNIALKFCDRYIAISEATKMFLINSRKLVEKKIEVIYHGIDIDKLRSSDKKVKGDLNLTNDDFVIGYFGRLSYAKGLEGLLESFKRISYRFKNAKLLLIGEGELEDYLKEKVIEKNLQDKCVFIKFQKDINKYYGLLDLYILPSFSEGINLALMEGMYNKVLVLSSDAGGSKEVIKDGYDGLLFPVGNFQVMERKISEVIENKTAYSTLEENAHNTILNRFNLSKNVLKIQNLFEELTNKAH